jgi:hypothetical protein
MGEYMWVKEAGTFILKLMQVAAAHTITGCRYDENA